MNKKIPLKERVKRITEPITIGTNCNFCLKDFKAFPCTRFIPTIWPR